MKKPADRPEMPVQKPRDPPQHAGDMPKLCSNCQHFTPDKFQRFAQGTCRNGISGKRRPRAGETCEYGFYPSIEKFPLKAGPGGIR